MFQGPSRRKFKSHPIDWSILQSTGAPRTSVGDKKERIKAGCLDKHRFVQGTIYSVAKKFNKTRKSRGETDVALCIRFSVSVVVFRGGEQGEKKNSHVCVRGWFDSLGTSGRSYSSHGGTKSIYQPNLYFGFHRELLPPYLRIWTKFFFAIFLSLNFSEYYIMSVKRILATRVSFYLKVVESVTRM